MNSRSVLAVALIVSCCAVRAVSAAEYHTPRVVMTTTGGPNSITLNVTINDNAALPGCTWFLIKRDGVLVPIAFSFQRQLGVQNTFTFTDTNVVPNRIYWYELIGSFLPVYIPSSICDEVQFNSAFGGGWGLPINIPGHVGTDPVPVAHGKLVGPPYEGFDAHIELCSGSEPWQWWYFNLLPGYEGYIGQDVLLYGDYTGWQTQFGWDFTMTSIALFPCAPVATEDASWGHVKSLYR